MPAQRRRLLSVLALVTYAADAIIIGTYGLTLRGRVRPFHWANALGCIPLIAVEVTTGAWPVLPLTAVFGVIGWIGVIKTKEQTR